MNLSKQSALEHELKRIFGSRIHLSPGPGPAHPEYVILWVQQAVRIHNNHALAAAITIANSLNLPLYAYYGLFPGYPGANTRHFTFLLQGLSQLQDKLEQAGIPMLVDLIQPPEGLSRLADKAAWIICDSGYTRIQRSWRRQLLERQKSSVAVVESDIIVPAAQTSGKEEYSAATIRPKIRRLSDIYLTPVHLPWLKVRRTRLQPVPFPASAPVDPRWALKNLNETGVNCSVSAVDWATGGETEAEAALERFISGSLRHYDDSRSDPGLNIQSELSPYLHFGHISPITAALKVMEASAHEKGLLEGASAFLEQLIIRRELAINFTLHNSDYDSPRSVPAWAAASMDAHRAERQDEPYSPDQLLTGETGDKYWNAAQKELVSRGKMHGYMRMYWGKRLLEWTTDWREAYQKLLDWNDTYSLDGRDPNGYAGIAWVFGKHDRPFPERPGFGKVRSMGERGLKRKFEMELYLTRVLSNF